ncbi:MlaA family lipoprotein [Sphingobium sp. EP60837]|uniref:MlaA family lipoprotein n=1 Tax=Sphingobium sp. EP60837 TaxID=1855519 RepID=UPI000830731F|nr:VacJ family lipoprotein [Sphingobium sp. EP60837]
MLLPGLAAGMLMMGAQAARLDAPAPELSPLVDVASARAALGIAVAPPSANGADDQIHDIVVTGAERAPPGDPFENLNAKSFEAVQSVDRAVVEPVAKAYNKGLPKPVRKSFRNFFANLQEPVVFAAYMLQLKPGKAMETAGRFTINSTLGVAGLFDMAKRKPFFLRYRPNGLANVLGYYGVGPGPYMYLPIVGPTTLRDIIGDTVDKMAVPFLIGKPFTKPAYVIPATILNQLGERAAFDDTVQQIRKEDDPYAAYRDLYLEQRKAEIEALHGRTSGDVSPVYGRRMGEDDAARQ